MEAYIQAAQQIKDDIVEEFLRTHPHIKREKILYDTPNGMTVLGGIDHIFKNSAKYKLFSQRSQIPPSPILEGDERFCNYINTHNIDSYNHIMDIPKFCRKISYFLFTSRCEQFTLIERNLNSDRLRKHELLLSAKSIELFNAKKSFSDLIAKGEPTEQDVLFNLIVYLDILNTLLVSRSVITRIEHKLCDLLFGYFKNVLIPKFSTPGFKIETSNMKALNQVIKDLHNQGIQWEKTPKALSIHTLENGTEALGNHLETIQEEIDHIREINRFIIDVVKYADPPESIKQAEEKIGEAGMMEAIRQFLSMKLAVWLSS